VTAEEDHDGRLSVIASFYPLAFVAQRIGGRCVEVIDLTPPGAEPHDLELTPDDVASIATADVVLYLGGGFQPAVEDAIEEAEGLTVDVLQDVSTLAESEQEQGGPAVDPHVWLDPGRFATVADQVEDALLRSGIPGRCGVRDRADELRDRLAALDQRFRAGLADCRLDVFVTSHAAFGYLADAYGLRQVAIAGLEPDTEPDPKRLADIAAVVRAEHVDTIFTEELVSPELAETLAQETGARTAVLATIEGLTEQEAQAGADYLSLMEEDLDALRGALDCA
jgi:zinc transport system substrate-binding protein